MKIYVLAGENLDQHFEYILGQGRLLFKFKRKLI